MEESGPTVDIPRRDLLDQLVHGHREDRIYASWSPEEEWRIVLYREGIGEFGAIVDDRNPGAYFEGNIAHLDEEALRVFKSFEIPVRHKV